MIGRLTRNLSYGNVTSTLALFLALGGTSYALTLPRDSVGSNQIRPRAVRASELATNAVRSHDVADRSLDLRDLSLSARASLRGASGPPGPTGPGGVTYRAAVNSASATVRGNATSNERRNLGEFLIGFNRSVDDCVSTATLATVEGAQTVDPPPGRITVARENGRVLVRTYDAAGAPLWLPFHLIVAC
jgi:hypothetical protein